MRDLGQYILSVGLASLLVGIIGEFTDKKSGTGTLTRMVCGLFLAFTVINPLTKLNTGILETFSRTYSQDVETAVSTGTKLAEESKRQIIKQETETYILDKARSLGCIMEAEVTVGKSGDLLPESVLITGSVPLQHQRQLEEFLERELGISKENQQWVG